MFPELKIKASKIWVLENRCSANDKKATVTDKGKPRAHKRDSGSLHHERQMNWKKTSGNLRYNKTKTIGEQQRIFLQS